MYISFVDSGSSYIEEIDHYLLVRYDMDTNKLNGITILNYSKHMDEFRAFPLPIKMDYDEIEHAML
jgi:hypothetical protein